MGLRIKMQRNHNASDEYIHFKYLDFEIFIKQIL